MLMCMWQMYMRQGESPILPRVSLLAWTRCTPVKLPGPMVARQLIIISLVQHKLLCHKVVQGDMNQQFADHLHVTLKNLHHLGAQAWTESSDFTRHARAWQSIMLEYFIIYFPLDTLQGLKMSFQEK